MRRTCQFALAVTLLVGLTLGISQVAGQGTGVGYEMDLRTDKESYEPGEAMVITGDLTKDGKPVISNITFQVDDPSGDTMLILTKMTDGDGLATITFKLDVDDENGTYKLYGSTSIEETEVSSPVRSVSVNAQEGEVPGPMGDWFLYLALLVVVMVVLAAVVVSMRRRGSVIDEEAERGPEASETFTVEDVFLMASGGLLINHQARRLRPGQEKDKEILGSMLNAIESFVEDSFATGENLTSLEYGDNKLIFQKGNHTCLCVSITGSEPRGLRDEMKLAVEKFEGLHAGVIEEWSGDEREVKDAKGIIAPLLAFVPEGPASEEPVTKVRVMSALEFVRGYIRLKVAVKNKGKTVLNDASFKLIYNRKALILEKVEPAYDREGSTVEIGNVEPGEKKSVAYYLDPLICMESKIEGVLTYKDYEGELQTLKMKTRPLDIVCPVFYTEHTVNAAMLKRLINEIRYSDAKMYRIPKKLDPGKAHELAKEAVLGHDVRFVREFKENDPFITEAWFYGRTKNTKEELVIRTAVSGDDRRLEMFIASSNLAMLTGCLAELGQNISDLMKQRELIDGDLESIKGAEGEEQTMDKTRFLIEKYAVSELEAEDGEI